MSDNEQPAAAPAADSAPALSLSDRIGNLFDPVKEPKPTPQPKQEAAPAPDAPTDQTDDGSAPTSDEPEQAAAPDADLEEVEFEGEKWLAPKKLKEALLRQDDYTRKTQEVAERARMVDYQSKALQIAESERKFSETVRDDVATAAQLDSQLQQYAALDWNSLSAEDAMRYLAAKEQVKERRQDIDRKIQQKHAAWKSEVEKSHSELVRKGLDALQKSIPNFSEATVSEIRQYGTNAGYSEAELANILDPRYVKTLWEAAQYNKLKASQQTAKQAIQKAQPIGKPTPTNPMPANVRDKLAYRKALQKAGPVGSRERQQLAKQRIADIFGR